MMTFAESVSDAGHILGSLKTPQETSNSASCSCLCHLRMLGSSCSSPVLHAIATLVHAMICAPVDFWNAVFQGRLNSIGDPRQSNAPRPLLDREIKNFNGQLN